MVAPPLLVELGSGTVATGVGLGEGFDAAGQTYKISTGQQQDYRVGQTLISGATGGVAAPFASESIIGNTLLGGSINAANTVGTNWLYGENENVGNAFLNGAIFSGIGTTGGIAIKSISEKVFPMYTGGVPTNPNIPILLQNFGKPNPIPGNLGSSSEQLLSNVPSFLNSNQLPFSQSPDNKGQ